MSAVINNVVSARGLRKGYKNKLALNGTDFDIPVGRIVGLIGPNGAGKTTFFNVLTGLYTADEGRFVFDGVPLKISAPHEVARAGIARTFQNIRLFSNMTALENVMVGRYCRTSSMALTSILRGPKFKREEAATRERAQELLDYVGLSKSTELLARNMPYGDCLLYTSDAADERSSVDLGGRRIIKKKYHISTWPSMSTHTPTTTRQSHLF